MRIALQCFATLAFHSPRGGSMRVEHGTKITDLLRILDIPEDEVRLVFINGKNQAHWNYELQPDDRVGIFPPVGGG